MKKCIFGLAVLFCTFPAWGANPTLRMGLTIPTTGQFNYPQIIANDLQIIDSSSVIQSTWNIVTASTTFTGSASTVTINQDLILGYLGAGQCLATGSDKSVITQACGGGSGSPAMAIYNGSSGVTGVAVSTPTTGINFPSSLFGVALQGGNTAFVTLSPSSATLQGNVFNGVSQLAQTNGSGQLPTSILGNVIDNQNTLQSGATFYTSSGTANNFQASTATVATFLNVLGAGLSGTQVMAQINGSALNVLANGNVGVCTAAPTSGLDVEGSCTAKFGFGVTASTMTVSTATVSGEIIFKDGSIQTTAASPGNAALAFSSGSATTSVIVSSPTSNIIADSTTFKVTLQGGTSSFFSVNFKGGGLTNTLLATDSNGVVISTTVSPSGNFINNQNTLQSGATFYVSSGTANTFYCGTCTVRNEIVFNDGTVITSTSTLGGGGSGTVNSGTAGQLAYYPTSTNAVSSFPPSGSTGLMGSIRFGDSSNQMQFSASSHVLTITAPSPAASETYTVPDVGAASTFLMSANSLQSGTTFYVSSGTVSGTLTAGTFSGSGASLTGVPASSISAGTLGSSVIASSITQAAMYGTPTFTGIIVGAGGAAFSGASTFNGGLTLGPGTTLSLFNSANTHNISLTYATISANYSLVMPTAQGTANTLLQNDGSGNLSFSDVITVSSETDTGSLVAQSTVTITSKGTSKYDLYVATNAPGVAGTLEHLSVSTQGVVTAYNVVVSSALNLSANKINNIANGSATSDAAAYGQINYGLQASSQCVVTTGFTATANTYSTSNLTCAITPTSTSSRIKITALGGLTIGASSGVNGFATIFRGSTNLAVGSDAAFCHQRNQAASALGSTCSMPFIDSPATTSQVTYTVKIKNDDNATTIGFGSTQDQVMILEEIR